MFRKVFGGERRERARISSGRRRHFPHGIKARHLDRLAIHKNLKIMCTEIRNEIAGLIELAYRNENQRRRASNCSCVLPGRSGSRKVLRPTMRTNTGNRL